MPTITSLSLADGQTTPVSTTFDAHAGQQGDKYPATWFARSTSFKYWKEITQLVFRKSNTRRVVVKLRMPGQNALEVDHSSLVTVSFIISDDAEEQDRKDMLAYVQAYMMSNNLESAVLNGEPTH